MIRRRATTHFDENMRRMQAEARKKYPRMFAPKPEMLWIREAGYYIENGAESGAIARLFGPFWLLSETAIMFAPPGVGKSLLATQIAESLARGVPLAPFRDHVGPAVPPQRVLYLDFELDRWQFTQRYTVIGEDGIECRDAYQFSPSLLRAEMYWDGNIIEGYEDYTDMLFEDIADRINEHEADVLIVDNVTFLTRGSTANAITAFRLMDRLRELKRISPVSILLVAHTPKRHRSGPLTENDLQGSIDLAKVADSVFALSRSRVSPDLRYLKQVKCRSGRIEHGDDNVAVFRVAKFDLAKCLQPEAAGADNFLGFDFVEFADEEDHVELLARPALSHVPGTGPALDMRLRIAKAKSMANPGEARQRSLRISASLRQLRIDMSEELGSNSRVPDLAKPFHFAEVSDEVERFRRLIVAD